MMDGDAVREVAELARIAAGEDATFEMEGMEVSTVPLHRAPAPALAPPVEFLTLTALAAYVSSGFDYDPADLQIIVDSPNEVRVNAELDERRQRALAARARHRDHADQAIGHWHSVEDMNLLLQSVFGDGGDRGKVLEVISNVASQSEVQNLDDGTSQTVVVTTGMKERTTVPNPVELVPLRSFPEITPTYQAFVFRMDGKGSSPRCKLIEIMDGRWAQETCDQIRDWLRGNVPDRVDVL